MTLTDRLTLQTAPLGHFCLQLASGCSSAITASKDPRASFYLYVPKSHPVSQRANAVEPVPPARPFPLLVLVHGSGRDAGAVRDAWADWAEQHGVMLACPLFPMSLSDLDDTARPGLHNYQYLQYEDGGRWDLLLLSILDDVERHWGFVQTERFLLSGFSGGAQFCQRFVYLHPQRVIAVSIGAPGHFTPIDESRAWPEGTADLALIFGTDICLEQLRQVRVHLIGGEDDIWESTTVVDGVRTTRRLARLDNVIRLAENLGASGCAVQVEKVPGVRHEEFKLKPRVERFFSQLLGTA